MDSQTSLLRHAFHLPLSLQQWSCSIGQSYKKKKNGDVNSSNSDMAAFLFHTHPHPAGLLRKENVAAHLQGTVGREGIIGQDKRVSQNFFHMSHETCIKTRSFKACFCDVSVFLARERQILGLVLSLLGSYILNSWKPENAPKTTLGFNRDHRPEHFL